MILRLFFPLVPPTGQRRHMIAKRFHQPLDGSGESFCTNVYGSQKTNPADYHLGFPLAPL